MPLSIKDRVLITGGAGFIGRNLIKRLVLEDVRPLVTIFKNETDVISPSVENKVDFVDLDLRDASATRQLIRKYRPTTVIHLAGVTGREDPTGKLCSELNYQATSRMLAELAETNVEHVVIIGTAAEYGNQTTPFRESTPARPISSYAVSKARANDFALTLYASTALPVTILRLFTVYGVGQPEKMFLCQLISHALSNRDFEMSDGSQRRDFINIADVTTAIIDALGVATAFGRIINIGSGKAHKLRDVAELAWKICKTDAEIIFDAVTKTNDDAADTLADIRLAKELLDWQPVISFETGLRDMIANFDRRYR